MRARVYPRAKSGAWNIGDRSAPWSNDAPRLIEAIRGKRPLKIHNPISRYDPLLKILNFILVEILIFLPLRFSTKWKSTRDFEKYHSNIKSILISILRYRNISSFKKNRRCLIVEDHFRFGNDPERKNREEIKLDKEGTKKDAVITYVGGCDSLFSRDAHLKRGRGRIIGRVSIPVSSDPSSLRGRSSLVIHWRRSVRETISRESLFHDE